MKIHWRKLFFVPIGIVGILILLTIMLQPHEFIEKEDAVKIVENQYHINVIPKAFVFLKYNGTYKGDPQFIVYVADPSSKTIQENGYSVVFQKYIQYREADEYLSDKLIDRFAWSVSPSGNEKGCCVYYYVDAKTGEVI